MKKLIMLFALSLIAANNQAQTPAEYLAAANSGVCENAGLSSGCTDAAVLVAWCKNKNIVPCTDSRDEDNKIYATPIAYANAVLIPVRQKEMYERRRNEIIEKLIRALLTDPTKCVAILTAGNLDTSVCK